MHTGSDMSIFFLSCRSKMSDQMNCRKLLVNCCPMIFCNTNAIRRGSFLSIDKIDSPTNSEYSPDKFGRSLSKKKKT